MPALRVWRVFIDDDRPTLFDDLDTAVAYARAHIAIHGAKRATLESDLMDVELFRALIEVEDGGGRDWGDGGMSCAPMTVAQFIDWLRTQDQGAIVEVVNHTSGRGYYDQGGNALVVDFNPAEHVDYTDLRGNPYIAPDAPHYNRRALLLGVHNG